MSSLSLQVNNMNPDVTEFAVTACEVLGCKLRAATSPVEQAALDIWLVWDLSEVVITYVQAKTAGQQFTSVDVIAGCRLVNPQAILK